MTIFLVLDLLLILLILLFAPLGFWRGPVAKTSRSRMNVVFRSPSDELDAAFVKEALAAGLSGLKGHRETGGLRASLYNALPDAAVTALVTFMREFERTRG